MTSITGNSYLDQFVTKTSATGTAAKGSGSLDQAAFLKLMTTQLQTQDPTAPTDNTQMIAQMAQFSQVAGVAEMNGSLKSILADLQGSRMGDAASWIGRSALVAGKTTTAQPDGSYAGRIALPDPADQVVLTLTDANGTIVHRQDLGKQPAGTVDYRWDGKDPSGRTVAGPLKVGISASSAKDGPIDATAAAWIKVTGVQSPAGGSAARLVTALGTVAPGDALSLS